MTDTPAPLARLQAALAEPLAAVEHEMSARMASDKTALIPQVANHLIGAGGKRLRPLLTLASARLFGEAGRDAVALAAAVEFIHNATLLHDDVIDESRRRRGRETANALYGSKPSVLVGDFLFARSFQLMVDAGSLDLLRILSDAAAIIVEGEVLQLSAEGSLAGGEMVYFQVIRGKTAALFAAACEAGARAGGADARTARAMAEYGDALGVAFQIADDWLDYAGTADTIGKTPGDDFREGKATLPVLLAHARGDADARAFWENALKEGGDFDAALVRLKACGALDETAARARAEAERARAALSVAPAGALRDALADLADYVVSRSA